MRCHLLLLVALNTSSLAQLNFAPAVAYDSGAHVASAVAVADVNGDGKPDLLVADRSLDSTGLGDGIVSVMLNLGNGTFGKAAIYDSGGYGATSIAVADVNGDGNPDLIVANFCAREYVCGEITVHGSVSVLLGNGDGSFQTAVTYDTGGVYAMSVAVTDLNGDGKPDLVVANVGCGSCIGSAVGVLLGNGDGTFQAAVTYGSGGSNANWIVTADVNGDGKPDVIVANFGGGGSLPGDAGVLLGNGDGTFRTAVTYDTGDYEAYAVAVADVNGDGKPDLLVSHYGASDTVGVLLGNGDGTFTTAVNYNSGGHNPTAVKVADLNGDGKPDLIVANYCAIGGPCSSVMNGRADVLLGNGDGTFQNATSYDSGGVGAVAAAVSDVNGDGKPDIVVSNQCGIGSSCPDDNVSVLLNRTPFCTSLPAIALSASPKYLWPANGKMVEVTVSGAITDNGCAVTSSTYAVTDEYGEAEPAGTVTLGIAGTYSFTVWLKASRLGTDMDGRLYSIAVTASNSGGRTGSQAVLVIVPHDQGH